MKKDKNILTKKLKLQGKISTTYSGSYDTIGLVQEDGYVINLNARLIELSELNAPNGLQINYHITDKLMSESELKELAILTLTGGIYAEFEKYEYRYSSWTTDVSYVTTLKVGNHDLYNELRSEDGKYVFFEINYN